MASNVEPLLEIQQMLTLVAQSIVYQPGLVKVDAETFEDATVLHLRVAPDDLPVITGSNGLIGRSLRDLLGDMGLKHKHTYALEITAIPRQRGNDREVGRALQIG